MDFLSTVKGSALEGFYPAGWDFAKIDACVGAPETVRDRQDFWNPGFTPIKCTNLTEFETYMGHEIALKIKEAADKGEKIAFIFPVGPMGMYKWVVYFLKAWNVDCKHVYTFNMDEWSDSEGNTLSADNPGAFQYAMEQALFNPLGELTVPKDQRNFATKQNLPTYPEKIAKLKAEGAQLVLVYGIGRMCHIAFWEPTFAADYATAEEWEKAPYRIGAKIHPLTVEQNALTSFKSRTTLVPCRANTIGPGLFLQADYAIGGADGVLGRGMQWQGLSLWMTLRHGKTPWITSSYIPTIKGKLFFLEELAGPLCAECN
ncbi:MAG: glucosamine-6-phosphate isomerase [Clostridia bacterium]|nr:glucosamine-6-phosphate isomerase [Clostridia bacterium]